jgi:putative ABC transport system permease protein
VSTASAESTIHPQIRRLDAERRWVRMPESVVVAVDPHGYRDLTSVRLLDGHLTDLGAGTVVLGPSAGEDGVGTPKAVLVDGKRLKVVARMAGTIAGGADVLVDRRDVAPAMLSRAPTTTFVGVQHGASLPEVASRLSSTGSVSLVSQWARAQATQEGRENAGVMGALAGLGGLYAFLSMVNAVAIGTAQRRREFAVARLTGASRRQVVVATVLEAMGVAAIGLVLGALVVALCLVGLRHGTDVLLGVPVLVVPWGLALGLTAAALVASAATAAAASWSATRLAPVRWVASRE